MCVQDSRYVTPELVEVTQAKLFAVKLQAINMLRTAPCSAFVYKICDYGIGTWVKCSGNGSFDSFNLSRILDCRSFSDFKP